MTPDPRSFNRPGAPAAEKKIAFAALHHRDYRRYFFVNLFSTMGDNIEHVISYWLLYQKFRSPVPMGLFLNVLMFLPMITSMAMLPYSGHGRDTAMSGRSSRSGLGGALRLLRETSSNPTILSMILLGGATSLLVGNAFQAQMPEYAHEYGHDHHDLAYSVLLGANAAGAVVGGLLLEGKGLLKANAHNAAVCSILWCLAIVGFAASSDYYLSVALLFCAGLLNLAFYPWLKLWFNLRHRRSCADA